MKKVMSSDKRIEVEEELADVLYFVLRFAQMNNIDLSSAVSNKIEKNKQVISKYFLVIAEIPQSLCIIVEKIFQ